MSESLVAEEPRADQTDRLLNGSLADKILYFSQPSDQASAPVNRDDLVCILTELQGLRALEAALTAALSTVEGE